MSHSIRESILFGDLDDFRLFVELLAKTQEDYQINVFAYSLLHTHYHLLLQTPKANLSDAMHYLNSVYSIAFNSKRKRIGHVMQGRYAYRLIEEQDYFDRAAQYITWNPVEAGLAESPEQWPFSSCRATLGLIPVPSFLDIQGLLNVLNPFTNSASDHRSAYIQRPMQPGWTFDSDLVLLRPDLSTIFEGTERNKGVHEAITRWEYKRSEVAAFLGMHKTNVGHILKKFSDSA